MTNLLKSFKTEIDPTWEQAQKIRRTIGTCRHVYNFYISHNKERYENGEPFLNSARFRKWLNNEYLPQHPERSWIKEVSSKSVTQSVNNAETAFQRSFEGKSGFPSFKKKGRSDVKMHFFKNNPKDCLCERHRIKIPTLGWVRLKEKGYLPVTKDGYVIRSGSVSIEAGRFYISVLVDIPDKPPPQLSGEGLGIDLGLKDLAICSDGQKYKNINKTVKVKKLEKQLRREQRCLSRRYEKLKKGEPARKRKNLQKQRFKIQKLYQRITCIRTDHVNKTIAKIVKTKPSYIVIEDLNVRGMMKNRHLSKAVASQKFYGFRTKLQVKCKENGIELRVVDTWYPSSKTCHRCGSVKKDLKLSDRIYRCKCGYVEDRDLNAAFNLRDAGTYRIA